MGVLMLEMATLPPRLAGSMMRCSRDRTGSPGPEQNRSLKTQKSLVMFEGSRQNSRICLKRSLSLFVDIV
jgi:hypothetical protein